MNKNRSPRVDQGFFGQSKPNKNVLKRGLLAGAAVAAGALGIMGIEKANKESNERYEKEQRAIEHVIDPEMDKIGGKTLSLATEHPDDFTISNVKEGVSITAFKEGEYDNKFALRVVIGLDAHGKPDPTKTLFVGITNGSSLNNGPGSVREATLTAPGGEEYAGKDVEGWTAVGTSLQTSNGSVIHGLGGIIGTTNPDRYLKDNPTLEGTAQYVAAFTNELFDAAANKIVQ